MNPFASRAEQNIGRILLLLLLTGCLIVMWPFLSSVVWAVVLCFSTWPVYEKILRWTRRRSTLSALLMSLVIALVILLPFVLIGFSMTDSVRELSGNIMSWIDSGPSEPPAWISKIPFIGEKACELWRNLSQDRARLLQMLKRVIEPTSTVILKVGFMIGRGLTELTLSIFVAFFLFRGGLTAADLLKTAVGRVAGDQGRQLLNLAVKTMRGVVYGIIGTAIVQAVMAGIGFWIAGVPGAGVLALLTFFFSPVPVGPPLLWGSSAVWLFSRGSVGWGIFMLAWGMGIVSSIDNVVRPWLISKESQMPFLLIFFGVIGGILSFGFIGVFLGPTLLSVGFCLVKGWITMKREALGAGVGLDRKEEGAEQVIPDQSSDRGI